MTKSSSSGAKSGSDVATVAGERLRTWRNEAGLSLREVSLRSGLSVSFISLVERGQTEIAVTRLIKLADVYGRMLSDVIGDNQPDSDEKTPLLGGNGARIYRVAAGVQMAYLGGPGWATQPFMITLEPGAMHGPVAHACREVVLCVDGRVTMVLNDEPIDLNPGDNLAVASNVYHAYVNTGGTLSRLIALDFRIDDDIRTLLATWNQRERSARTCEEAVHRLEGSLRGARATELTAGES